MTDRADADAIAAILRRGDESAFGTLYERHSPALFRLALAATDGERADAEDVLHDTWLIAMQKLGTFASRSRLRTWLSGILLNRARQWRRSPALGWLELRDDDTASVEPPAVVERATLERALAHLPTRARLVLILHDAHGHTHEEIGAMMGIEIGTSKSQLSRARRAMIEQLADREETLHGPQ